MAKNSITPKGKTGSSQPPEERPESGAEFCASLVALAPPLESESKFPRHHRSEALVSDMVDRLRSAEYANDFNFIADFVSELMRPSSARIQRTVANSVATLLGPLRMVEQLRESVAQFERWLPTLSPASSQPTKRHYASKLRARPANRPSEAAPE